MRLLLLISVSLVMLACSSKKKEHIEHIIALKLTSDSITANLKSLDPAKAHEWHEESVQLREGLIASGTDTIPPDLASAFDHYFSAMNAIADFSESFNRCSSAADSLSIRLKQLQKDVESQSGERSQYKAFIQFETAEAQQLRKHAIILVQQYRDAETARAQFLPPVERFIRTFVEK